MSFASLPVREPQRLAAVHTYAIPDAPNAKRLDIFTRIAMRICNTPVGMISLVDEDSLHCKSAIGFDPRESGRPWAPCVHTILQPDEVTVSEDVTIDERFLGSDAADGSRRIRFYAGAPLCNQDGISLGALCVVDSKPRKARDEDLSLLRCLADGLSCCLEAYRGSMQTGFDDGARRSKPAYDTDMPISEWELMADWLADAHPECGRQVTDRWVPHYMRQYPRLVERLMIQAQLKFDVDCAIP